MPRERTATKKAKKEANRKIKKSDTEQTQSNLRQIRQSQITPAVAIDSKRDIRGCNGDVPYVKFDPEYQGRHTTHSHQKTKRDITEKRSGMMLDIVAYPLQARFGHSSA